jgi:hypothetical protein
VLRFYTAYQQFAGQAGKEELCFTWTRPQSRTSQSVGPRAVPLMQTAVTAFPQTSLRALTVSRAAQERYGRVSLMRLQVSCNSGWSLFLLLFGVAEWSTGFFRATESCGLKSRSGWANTPNGDSCYAEVETLKCDLVMCPSILGCLPLVTAFWGAGSLSTVALFCNTSVTEIPLEAV